MFSKAALFLSVFAVSTQVAVATPPSCLLAAVNTQQQPWNLAAMCGDASKQVTAQIKNLCGGNTQAAMSAYQQTCKSAGHAVVVSSSSSSSSSSTGTSSSSGSPSTMSTMTMSGSSFSAGPTGSSGSPTPSGLTLNGNGNSASNGTSYTPITPTPPTQPSLGPGSGTSTGAFPETTTGAASHIESPGLAGLVFAAAGLIMLV